VHIKWVLGHAAGKQMRIQQGLNVARLPHLGWGDDWGGRGRFLAVHKLLSCLSLRTSHRFLGNLDLLSDGRFIFVRRR
jgi:hypothetical protein